MRDLGEQPRGQGDLYLEDGSLDLDDEKDIKASYLDLEASDIVEATSRTTG